MKKFRNFAVAVFMASVSIGISACSPQVIPEPNHKARTTACLIRSSEPVAGTPEKQLAADLVEAKIVYGLAVREVKIAENTSEVPKRLLQALQAGCVLMVSANTEYMLPLADFAKAHPNMLVLFVGSEINVKDQPTNFRWVADDIQDGARLAGFFAAGQSSTGLVHLFVQGNYFQTKSIQTSFALGVNDFDRNSGSSTRVATITSSKALPQELASLETSDVAAIFAGRGIWQSLPLDQTERPFLIGADLQLGDTTLAFESRVQVSLERNTSKYVFNAVSSLLDRQFISDPLYRKPGSLKFNTLELRITQPDSVAGSLLEALNAYKQGLITNTNG